MQARGIRATWALISWRPKVQPLYDERALARSVREVSALTTHPFRFGAWSLVWSAAGAGVGVWLSFGRGTGAAVFFTVLALVIGGIASFVVPLVWFAITAPVVQRNEARAALRTEAPDRPFAAELDQLEEIADDIERLRGDIGKRTDKAVGGESNQLTNRASQILRRIDPKFADSFTYAKPGEDLRAHINLCVRMLRHYVEERRQDA